MPKLPEPKKDEPQQYNAADTGTDLHKYQKVGQLLKVRADIKKLKKQEEELKAEINTYFAGIKANDAGNRTVIIKHGTNAVEITSTLRVTSSLKEDAVEVLKTQGYADLIETTEYVREDALAVAIQEEEIPNRILKLIYESNENYALSAKPVKPGAAS
jgi:hypothetical protein